MSPKDGCNWPLEPSWYPTHPEYPEHSAECGAPARPAKFRRKSDGRVDEDLRCDAHRRLCNRQWEPVEEK